MWDRQRRRARQCELHRRKASGRSDGRPSDGQPLMVRDHSRASTPEAISASGINKGITICLLGCTAESSAPGYQVASHHRSGILALGCFYPRCEWTLRVGFKAEPEAACADGFWAHEAEVVY